MRRTPLRSSAGSACAWTILFLVLGVLAAPAFASHTPEPSAVTVAGDLQSELGCSGDWQPDCADTHLALDAEDGVWQGVFNVPAGDWQYKAPVNDSWDENYGADAQPGGANIGLSLGGATDVKFYYSHATHWITDDVNSTIAVAPGSFQSELGCASDWDPTCLRSWLQDPDGDGTYTLEARLPAGSYEAKVAIGESWTLNYGAGGAQNGPNIPFTVASDCQPTIFSWDSASKVLTISAGSGDLPQPSFVTIPGSLQSELGCPGDWMPGCTNTDLAFDAADQVWQGTFNVPAGNWEYKVALNHSWDENYGANAVPNGANLGLSLGAATDVKLYWERGTNWVADDVNQTIAVAPGSFQSELGCPGDWQPDCLRSWLQDPDGDGIYSFSTRALAAGSYEAKVAIGESWDLNYGAGGAQNGANISFTVPTSCAEVFFNWDSDSHELTVGAAGAPRGNLNKAQAYWLGEDLIAWRPAGALPGPSTQVTLYASMDGGLGIDPDGLSGPVGTETFALTADPAGVPAAVAAKFPHLAALPAFRIAAADLAKVPAALTGQIAVAAVENGTLIDATALQIPGVLDDLYAYDGDLGVSFDGAGVPTIRVWAPTAQSLSLHLFADSNPATTATVMAMTPDAASGVWSITGDASWKGQYYLYEAVVFARSTGAVETNRVTDPYSLSLSRDSLRTQIVDLADPALKPVGWDALVKPPLRAPEDIVLYELHVRDFSAQDPSVPAPLKGTFEAFALPGTYGTNHLKALADAGLTHVHLLPSFDIATVAEDRSQWLDPGDLSVYGPAAEDQQAAVGAIADQDAFNWGYDPFHYTVPEGSYATDADGPARIVEFRDMVQALSDDGLRVVMDVVYNHTNASGQNAKSVLDRIVPGYYHRLNADGDVERSSCCDNTASEHDMMEKLLIDSVVTWARQYKVDGFRFDLMGHHMKRNMLALRAALDALTLQDDGVDGSKIYLYGEGWNFGEVANNARGVNATQLNMAGTGIGTFSDRLRDAARGGGPFSGIQEQGFLTGLYVDPNATDQGSPADQLATLLREQDQIRIGLAGNLADYPFIDRFGNVVAGSQVDYNGQPTGYTADPQEVISYVAAHDNETLFDTVQLKAAATDSIADRVRMQDLGLSLVTLGQGIPFWHAGMDLLRSKSLDRNSYNSGDWFNKLDFTYASNNWGVGLPPQGDNGSNWSVMAPLLADPALAPASSDVQATEAHAREVLAIRRSTPLFRLTTAQEVIDRVRFHNTGPGQVPGLIVMSISDDDGSIDRGIEHVAVVFNAGVAPVAFAAPALAGLPFALHPLQAASADAVVRTASYAAGGTFSVPARTTAVFVAERPAAEQVDLLIADVEALVAAGALNGGQGNALSVKLQGALAKLAAEQPAVAVNKLQAFVNQLNAFVQGGVLTAEEAAPLLDAAAVLLAQLGA